MSELWETLQHWKEAFQQNLRVRDYSPLTIELYGYDLNHFFEWLEERNQCRSVADVTNTVLREYQTHLMLRPGRGRRYRHPRSLNTGTRNRILASIKSFFRYLRKSGKLLSNPAAELESARHVQKLPKAIPSIAEMERLLRTIPNDTDVGIHDQAVFELLYSAGLRRAEFLNLKLNDLRLAEGFVHVLGKGRKERIVPIGKTALAALRLYLAKVRPVWAAADCDHVFVSKLHGRNYDGGYVMDRLKRYVKRAQLRKSLTFHSFRHAFATHMLEGGADIRSIQLLMGHSELDVTSIYLHVEPSRLREIVLLHHPRETNET